MARIAMITGKEGVSKDRESEIDAIIAAFGHVAGPSTMLLYSPGLSPKFAEAAAYLRAHSTLSVADREVVTLAVARENDAGYSWSAHVGQARDAGVAEDVITAIRDHGTIDTLDPNEQDLISYVRQLIRDHHIEETLFQRLLTRHDERWLVEMTALIGQYQYISAITSAFEVEPAPGAELLPI